MWKKRCQGFMYLLGDTEVIFICSYKSYCGINETGKIWSSAGWSEILTVKVICKPLKKILLYRVFF